MSWVPDVRKTLGQSILVFHTLTWWAPTVILSMYFCRFLLFVDHVDNARGRRHGKRTKARRGLGVNDLGDGGAAMRALRRSQPWEAEAGGPTGAGLVLAAGGRQEKNHDKL